MPLDTAVRLVDLLRQSRLLESESLNELVRDLLPHFADPRALAGELIRRGWLTPYQANLLLQGRHRELLLGSYVLLERVGEGGMGQVFKARNWKLGRVVALKVIKKERLASEDAVRRFHREIRAAAQLAHPNIVLAFGADEATARTSLRWSTSRAPTWRSWSSSTAPCRWRRRATGCGRRRWGFSTLTSAAWSTATSSRTTCC